MPEEDFLTNIARMIAGTLAISTAMQASRELYGKSYFALGAGEKASLDQLVFGMIAGNYQTITPENLKKQTAQAQAGFQVPASKAT